MKIAILDDYQNQVRHLDCFSLLHEHEVTVFNYPARGVGQLAVRLARFDAVVLLRERTALPASLLNRLLNLKLIVQTGKLTGHVDVAAATARGIQIVEGVSDPTAPAELTWALILAATRHVPAYVTNLRKGLWQTVSSVPEQNRLGRILKGQTLGIWGYGRVGRLVAGYGKAFGMEVLVWGGASSLMGARADRFDTARSRLELLQRADILTLHLRLTPQTHAGISASDLACMKTTALLVNTSRAELLAQGALEQALSAGRPGSAALDVFESEPLATQASLLQRHNVLVTPHIGFVEQQSYERYFGEAFRSLLAFAASTSQKVCDPARSEPLA